MKKIILILVPVLVLAALSYFAYPIVKNRYFNDASENIQEDKKAYQASSVSSDDFSDTQSDEADESEDSPESSPSQEEITPIAESECEEECSDYSSTREKNSCLEECKTSASKDESGDCANLSGTEKDSCWKEKAIKENKFEHCDNIGSSSVKKSCKDRLTENILESQTSE